MARQSPGMATLAMVAALVALGAALHLAGGDALEALRALHGR